MRQNGKHIFIHFLILDWCSLRIPIYILHHSSYHSYQWNWRASIWQPVLWGVLGAADGPAILSHSMEASQWIDGQTISSPLSIASPRGVPAFPVYLPDSRSIADTDKTNSLHSYILGNTFGDELYIFHNCQLFYRLMLFDVEVDLSLIYSHSRPFGMDLSKIRTWFCISLDVMELTFFSSFWVPCWWRWGGWSGGTKVPWSDCWPGTIVHSIWHLIHVSVTDDFSIVWTIFHTLFRSVRDHSTIFFWFTQSLDVSGSLIQFSATFIWQRRLYWSCYLDSSHRQARAVSHYHISSSYYNGNTLSSVLL